MAWEWSLELTFDTLLPKPGERGSAVKTCHFSLQATPPVYTLLAMKVIFSVLTPLYYVVRTESWNRLAVYWPPQLLTISTFRENTLLAYSCLL